MPKHAPQVSIGLPVFNGENYLRQCLDSILSQSYTDYELIISDNGSTDGTRAICEAYAARDDRIRYHRYTQNHGVAWNFNNVFRLSSGEYFKWVAHDDLHAPDFIMKCVEVLDQQPDVILCHSKVKIIDARGAFLQDYQIKLNTESPEPCVRFNELLRKHLCYQIYGLTRASALRQTPLLGSYAHSDEILLLRLGLLGRFYELPKYLFFSRYHPRQSISMFCPGYLAYASEETSSSARPLPDYYGYTLWFNPQQRNLKYVFPHWRILWELLMTLWRAPVNFHERLRCLICLPKQHKGEMHLLLKDLIRGVRQLKKGEQDVQ